MPPHIGILGSKSSTDLLSVLPDQSIIKCGLTFLIDDKTIFGIDSYGICYHVFSDLHLLSVIDKDKCFRGGAIAPGVMLSYSALAAGTGTDML